MRDALGLKTRIVGVGAERASAVAESWRTGTRIVGKSADTFAEGVATRVTFDLTFGILQRGLDDFVLLSEDELADGVRAGAAPRRTTWPKAPAAPRIAAALKCKDQIAGQRVVCVMSGGNMDPARLRRSSRPDHNHDGTMARRQRERKRAVIVGFASSRHSRPRAFVIVALRSSRWLMYFARTLQKTGA